MSARAESRFVEEGISAAFWSLPQLGTGLEALARRSKLQPSDVPAPHPPSAITTFNEDAAGRDALNQWIETAANWLGIEAEPSTIPYEELETIRQRGTRSGWSAARRAGSVSLSSSAKIISAKARTNPGTRS